MRLLSTIALSIVLLWLLVSPSLAVDTYRRSRREDPASDSSEESTDTAEEPESSSESHEDATEAPTPEPQTNAQPNLDADMPSSDAYVKFFKALHGKHPAPQPQESTDSSQPAAPAAPVSAAGSYESLDQARKQAAARPSGVPRGFVDKSGTPIQEVPKRPQYRSPAPPPRPTLTPELTSPDEPGPDEPRPLPVVYDPPRSHPPAQVTSEPKETTLLSYADSVPTLRDEEPPEPKKKRKTVILPTSRVFKKLPVEATYYPEEKRR